MTKKYKWAVYMGRFQPFHDGHMATVKEALAFADNVIILIGGIDKARQAKNPWTYLERMSMILKSIPYEYADRVVIGYMHDHPYSNSAWVDEVKTMVGAHVKDGESVAIVGHHKDASSYYLDLFPDWSYEEVANYQNIDATTIRDIYFGHPCINIPAVGVPDGTLEMLYAFRTKPEYVQLSAEHAYIKSYKLSWDKSPFPPMFITVDIAVLNGGNILTISRGNNPGKGLRALPGGYLDVNERIVDSARRELAEETCLSLSREEFSKRLVDVHVFDHPNRSQIGRVVTHLHVINATGLGMDAKAADDAASISWLPIDSLSSHRGEFSSDHWYMCEYAADKYLKTFGG